MTTLAALLPLDAQNQDRSLALVRHLLRVGLAEGCLAVEIAGVPHLGVVASEVQPVPAGDAVIIPFPQRRRAA